MAVAPPAPRLERGLGLGAWRDDNPRVELEPVRAGDEPPGGLTAHHDGCGVMETPVYLPERRALVFEREPWSTWTGA